jgi:aspartate/methionine/tyrosine aminotransferase
MESEAERPASRTRALAPTAVNSILAEVRQLRLQGRTPISLMRGEPDLATPAHIVEAACRALRDGRTGYPDNRGEPALREAVAEKLLRDTGFAYDPDTEILITSGATFGVWAALTATLNEGEEVLLPDPIYDAYVSPIRLAGGRPRPVRARIEQGRFRLGVEALEAVWTPACRLLLLNTPWNPTGTVFTREELAAIADFCRRRRLLLASDEIYEAIIYDGRRHVSPASLSEAARAGTVLINSFSKTYAMTGWRVGYVAAARPLIDAMYLVLQQSSRGPATFVQDAAVAALRGPQDCVARMREEYDRRRALVVEALRDVPGAGVLVPEGGFFAMVDVRDLGAPSNEIRRRLLCEHEVVVVHGAAYGAGGEGTLRVSFASGGDNLTQGLARLRQGLMAWRSRGRSSG